MKRTAAITMTLILALLLPLSIRPEPANAVNQYGPRNCAGTVAKFYNGLPQAFSALQAGDVDFLNAPLTIPMYEAAMADPNILLCEDSSPCAVEKETGKIPIKVVLHLVKGSGWTEQELKDQLQNANEIWGCSFKYEQDGPTEEHDTYDKTKNKECRVNIWGVKEKSWGTPSVSGYDPNLDEQQLTKGDGKNINIKENTLAHELGHIFDLTHCDVKGCPGAKIVGGKLVYCGHLSDDNIMRPDNEGSGTESDPKHSCHRTGSKNDNKDASDKTQQDRAKESARAKKGHAAPKGTGYAAKDIEGDVMEGFIDIVSYYAFAWGGNLFARAIVSVFSFTECELGFYIESDNNLATGMPYSGIDYFVGFCPAENTTILRRYDEGGWVTLDSTGIACSTANGWDDSIAPSVPSGVDFVLPIQLMTRRAGRIVSVQAVAQAGASWDYAPDSGPTPFFVAAQYGYRKSLTAIISAKGLGPENIYTLLNAYRTDGNPALVPIRIGVVGTPEMLNPLYSRSGNDWTVLNMMTQHLLNINPYDLAIIQPWIAQDWLVGEWFDAPTNRTLTKVTYWLRENATWMAPVTGEALQPLTAHDIDFSIWYIYSFRDGWNWPSVKDVHHTRIINDYCIEVYFNVNNPKAVNWIGFQIPFLYKNGLLNPLCANATETWSQTGSSEHSLAYNVTKVTHATLDGEPLQEGVDYIVKTNATTSVHNVFLPLSDLTGTLAITYWYPDIPASGFYLADLPWQQTMYSIGPYYPTYIGSETEGFATMHCNPHYFLETPLLAEIDWRWTWSSGPQPRSGYFKIDILDVVKCTGAYCSRGDGTYNPKWYPGADLDPSDVGHIGILDLVTITGKYAKTFGTPP